MPDFYRDAELLVWPLAIALAWAIGEVGHRWSGVPRISIYSLVGFMFSHAQTGVLPRPSDATVSLLANIAFGLILFEFGYRINLKWLRLNPWIGITAAVQAAAIFCAVYFSASAMGVAPLIAMLLASLAIASSPAELLRVVNEQRSGGQATERTLHLAAISCFAATFAFNIVVGLWTFQTSGSLWQAVSSSLLVLILSAAAGILFGMAVPAALRQLGAIEHNGTIAFALAVILLTAVTHTLKGAPILAALTFGVVARHRRLLLGQTQRNFGVLGDILAVLLFVFIGASLSWTRIASGLDIALVLLGVRFLVQVAGVTLFARIGGTTWRKGALTGLALSPMSVFAVAILVQTRHAGINLMDQLAPLAAATFLSAVAGPVLAQWAFKLSGETTTTTTH